MSNKFNSPQETIGWVGNGAILMSELDANDKPTGGWRNLGQVSSALVALSSEKIEMADTMQGTLSTAQSLVIKNTAELSVTMKSFSPENLALALYGDSVIDAEEAAATYQFSVALGYLEVLPGIITGNLSVQRDSDSLDVTENFTINNGSIYTPADQSGFTNPLISEDVITVTYDKASVKRVEAFVNSSKNVALTFDGFNIANSDKAVKVSYHKVSLDPAAQRQLISTDYAEQEIKGTLLASSAVTGVGESKLFKEEHQV